MHQCTKRTMFFVRKHEIKRTSSSFMKPSFFAVITSLATSFSDIFVLYHEQMDIERYIYQLKKTMRTKIFFPAAYSQSGR